jgi:YD repeat-containing protein
MSGRRTFLGNAAAAVVITKISSLRSFGFATEGPETIDPTKSDREKAGLRGPVEQCIEETIIPPSPSREYPETRFTSTTKYDPTGRILHVNSTLADGTKLMGYYSYDSQGRLVKTTNDQPSGPPIETNYTYDERGRLIGVTGYNGQSSTFQYDDQGRKTRLVRAESDSSSSGADPRKAASFYVVDPQGDELFMPAPDGGQVKTLFNKRGQATESQVYAANGHLVSSTVRSFDAEGRVVESNNEVENLVESMVPAEDLEQLMAEPEALEKLQQDLTEHFGSLEPKTRNSYIYDEAGRVVEERVSFEALAEKITKITYNDHGDKMEEHETTLRGSNSVKFTEVSDISSNAQDPSSSGESNVRYNYQYDSYGNWTEQTISYRSGANARFTISTVRHRTILYY